MDKIEIILGTYKPEFSSSYCVADIFVDSKNLMPVLEAYEESGGHAPITPLELRESLLKKYLTKQVPIYGCGCGVCECYPIYIIVEVGENFVKWKNFNSPAPTANKKFGELIFDKKQYFAELRKLDIFCSNDSILKYGGIECGVIKLILNADGKNFGFLFDEILNDPLPQLVQLYNAVKNNEGCEIILEDEVPDNPPLLKISAQKFSTEKFKLSIEIIKNKLCVCEDFLREELLATLEKIFINLLNDKYFPYSYPCFSYCYDNKNCEAVTTKLEEEHPIGKTVKL